MSTAIGEAITAEGLKSGIRTNFQQSDMTFCFNHLIGRAAGVGNKFLGIDVGKERAGADEDSPVPAIILTGADGEDAGEPGYEDEDGEEEVPLGKSLVGESCKRVQRDLSFLLIDQILIPNTNCLD